MMPVLHLGPLTIPAAPLTLLLALLAFLEFGDRAAKRLQLSEGVVSSALMWALGVGLVSARLGYVLRYWDAYAGDPLQIFALNLGTLDTTLAVIGGGIAALVYLQRKQIDLRTFGDAIAPALALAMAIVSLGNLLSGDAYGIAAPGLPWAIVLWGEPRHPVQIYEMFAYALLFVWLWTRAPRPFAGATCLIAVAVIAAVRLVLEPLRGDSALWLQGIRIAQMLALGVLVAASALYVRGLRIHERP